jgi:hypothetical protein
VRANVTRHSTDLLWHIWLLYYYLSIALRENIMKANGSDIHGWWFMHHYISMVGIARALNSPTRSLVMPLRRCPAPT